VLSDDLTAPGRPTDASGDYHATDLHKHYADLGTTTATVAFTIALYNQKGGVGKTTNTINLAGALAARGRDVLVADLDPQGYLTFSLGFESAYRDGSPALADALRDPPRVDAARLVRSHPEFSLLPADESLRSGVQRLGRRRSPPFGTVGRLLADAAAGHEIVLVDSPPVQNPFTDAIVADCGDVLVPVELSEPSVYAFRSLVDYIVGLDDGGVRVRALLLSDVTYPLDNEQKRVLAWLEDNVGDRCPSYEIRHRAAIQRSLNAGSSVFGADAESTDMREVYDRIAAQVERLAGLADGD
jgi:chromosome partitioning protein